ncbi:MAG: TRC40/GET3/ArsA family transport-energizing ATPase [Archaeoglobaceae archaeon]|nr:TRC40/GET3/ArsA family transport-energizing ATPase [Archaeoglobaceae archaeon]
MSVILFTGKGGVGKTTVAAMTGIRAANLGYKTLIISTDPAHSLSDSFQFQLGAEPTKIRDRLYGMEVNVEHELKKHWEEIKYYLLLFFKSQGIEDVIAEELAIFPGFDEIASLLNLLEFYEKGDFDTIILDCAPTGETLRLLSVPEIAKWYMNRFFGIEKKLIKMVKPIAEPLIKIPLPTEEIMDKIQEMYVRISKIKDILESDDSVVRIVVNPEKMVIKESERAFTYLNIFGYTVDCVIVNKVFPQNTGEFFSEWVKMQEEYMKRIRESFPVPIFQIPFQRSEIVGEKLFELSEKIFDFDPTKRLISEKPMKIEKEEEGFVMSIKAPFIRKEDLKIYQRGEELLIIAGQWKRTIFLPQALSLREIVGASFNNNEIRIKFR